MICPSHSIKSTMLAWVGVAMGLAIAAFAFGPIVLWRHEEAARYSSDATVLTVAANLLLFAAFWQLFYALQVCAIGARLQAHVHADGADDHRFWGVGIPLGSWLGYRGPGGSAPLEVYGSWVGLVVGLVLMSLAAAWTLRAMPDARLRSAPVASTEPMRAAR